MMELAYIGIVLVSVGILLIAFSAGRDAKFAAGGFIGPVPFGFGNDLAVAAALLFMFSRARS